MASLSPMLIRKLRSDPRIRKAPPYISLLCILGGIIWVLLLPLNRYSRQTYISENALLPGQVHTYLGGSEQNIFRAYKHEIASVLGSGGSEGAESDVKSAKDGVIEDKIEELFRNTRLKTARQAYRYMSAGKRYKGENVYAILHAPRGDSTEAIVLVAALKDSEERENLNGVALLITLARYFKRWSLWSKDIIFLVTPDSLAGPQAWIDAYHSTHDPTTVQDLILKSGALQGAVCINYPLNHRFETVHISYDGINGQLPNLDLFNTAVSIASGQGGIGTSIQGMHKHDDSYPKRLLTLLKGMSSQAIGHATGPHSVFMPYHIDAITLTAVGQGWQDEMALGRTVESICRSLNNLLEHLHQSFFFYLLMQSNRFVSIGTYLPSAMAVAAGFTIMAIHLWVEAGRQAADEQRITKGESEKKSNEKAPENSSTATQTTGLANSPNGTTGDRRLILPISTVASIQLLGLIPLYLTSTAATKSLPPLLFLYSVGTLLIPVLVASTFPNMPTNTTLPAVSAPTTSQHTLIQSLSLLLLGLFLSALATLNFSLSMFLGIACAPLAFVRRTPRRGGFAHAVFAALVLVSPPVVLGAGGMGFLAWGGGGGGGGSDGVATEKALVWWLERMAFAWNVWGSWGVLVGLWCIWWPAWIVAASEVAGSWFSDG